MRIMTTAAILAIIAGTQGLAEAPGTSLRPEIRPGNSVHLAAVAGTETIAVATEHTGAKTVTAGQSFDSWRADFRARAMAQGIRADVFDGALRGVTPDPVVLKRDRNQNEFTKTIWKYLETAVSDARIRNGRAALDKHRDTLERIEAHYGVDKQIIVAIWGLESAYGGFRGNDSTIRSLATLAHDPRRRAFFEGQLMAALQILQAGDVSASNMRGSWAGAMGHTQFMPTSYLEHAVDYTGDGRRDIWSDDPRDSLASTAAYLKHFGWTHGQPWGVEVRLPAGFDYTLANRVILKSPSEWSGLGIRDTDGRPVPDHGQASILLPAGGEGAAFMIFDNFEVLERYNTADAYVIGVGHLGDRILGGKAIESDWPFADRALSFDERKELQQRLTRLGFDTEGIDGLIGPKTIDAVRAYQVARGLTPDGYASPRFLERLR